MDGIVSAALAARAYGVRSYVPYTHAAPGETPECIPDAIGVDIPYIPGMVRWFDHHVTGTKFLTPEVIRACGQSVDATIRYDPTAPACVTLLPHPPAFAALVAEVTQLDSAKFPTAAAACDLTNPVIRASATVMRLADHALETRVIDALADASGDGVDALRAAIPASAQEDTVAVWRTHGDIFRRLGTLESGVLAIDASGEPAAAGCSTFLAYREWPDAVYGVICTVGRDEALVSISRNPWHATPREPLRLDAIASRHGGGGHPSASGVTFPATSDGIARANAVYKTVVAELRATHA